MGLYSGPSNLGYETLAQLDQNARVIPLATFENFAQVQIEISGTVKTGFVPKDSLTDLPNSLPKLDVNEVPWMTALDALKLSGWGISGVFVQNGQLIHHSIPTSWITTVNTLDPVLITGPFGVRIQFSGEGESYGVLLFGALNQGDWWRGIRRLDVDASYNGFALLFYDGTSEKPQYFKLPQTLRHRPLTLRFDEEGKQITVLDSNGRVAGGFHLTGSLFPSQRFYLGVNAGLGGTLYVSELKVLLPPTGKILTAMPSLLSAPKRSAGLRDLADQRGLEFGSLGSPYRFGDAKYAELLASNYNLILSEDFHWGFGLRPDAQHYNFSAGEQIVAFARRYNMRVQAHHLVWGFQYALPKWLLNGNYTREQLLQLIHDHITTVVGHFRGRVHEWTVVNEPLTNDQFWGPRIGQEYIEMAFRWAREADPNATLILNQDGDEDRRNPFTQRISDGLYNLARDLKQKGVPIDGIGMQMHLSINDPPKKQDVIENMRRFGQLGIKVYVTELDVNLYGASGTTEEKYARQAQVYRDMFEACLESGVCQSFIMFGFRDADSWLVDPNVQRDLGLHGEAPLIFDNNYNPKPAYFAIRDVLTSK